MAASPETTSMALFCDFENVALGVRDARYEKFDIKKVLERLLLKGSIVVKKAYCDWDRYREFKAQMHEANFELIEIPHVRQSGKNSADIRMVVDALDLCYTKSHVDTFVIISGDSDFSPLVSKLRENAKTVIGVGVKGSTSDLLTANCDEFIFYDDLVRAQEARRRRVRQQAGDEQREPARDAAKDRPRQGQRPAARDSRAAGGDGMRAAAREGARGAAKDAPKELPADVGAAAPEGADGGAATASPAPQPALEPSAGNGARRTPRRSPRRGTGAAGKSAASADESAPPAPADVDVEGTGGAPAPAAAADDAIPDVFFDDDAPAAGRPYRTGATGVDGDAPVGDAEVAAVDADAEADADAGDDRPPEATRRQEAIDLVVETVEALITERGADDKIWGSMVKQTLKRRRPGFAESYYGYRSFNELLEDARRRNLVALDHDEKSGGYVIRLL